MMSTPRRVTGSFPQTPATVRPRRTDPTPQSRTTPLPVVPENEAGGTTTNRASQPVIPLTLLDGHTQRFYATAVYIGLLAWRVYDWIQLVETDEASWALFVKWMVIDLVYLFGLPELRIPWLELSQPVVVVAFLLHASLNFILMFNIPIPWRVWLIGIAKVFYDRELSISEQRVKASSILFNDSLIMGKQIINILPEGSAVLNPEELPFCIGDGRNVARLPIQFNASVPAEIEFVRVDLDSYAEEIVRMSKGDVRSVAKAIKAQGDSSAVTWEYPVKKTGAYRLLKVLDEYKLEVQRKSRDTYVVPCPTARIVMADSPKRCIRDLSDLSIAVEGTPPLKIGYSRMIDGKDHSFHLQSIQPDGFISPLLSSPSSSLIHPLDEDISWVRPQEVRVTLNETMGVGGEWQYLVDEVHDAFGNVAQYTVAADDVDLRPKPKHLVQKFDVKERPRVYLQGCDLRNPIKVAKGRKANLPVHYAIPGRPVDTSHSLSWEFSPIDTLTNSGDHGSVVSIGTYSAKTSGDRPIVSEPGLYTLKSVASDSCDGEVQEPSSCLLLNPLEPQVSIKAEDIPDKCAGNSIGLRVDLDLIGTPPFVIRYDVVSNDGSKRLEKVEVSGLRTQIELLPKQAGLHKYIFKTIDDAVYKGMPLSGPGTVLQQDVKPAASARITYPSGNINACLDQEVEVDVFLLGDAPFTLEYELVHDGKRKSEKISGIETNGTYKIRTAPLAKGGEYILALSSIQDRSGCRTFLKEELKISVRRQRPRAAFGLVENKQKITAVESAEIRLPLRLQGVAPWTVSYRNLNGSQTIVQKTASSGNDHLTVKSRGIYEIVDVSDSLCSGTVDPKASTFEVDWFPRPEISFVPTDTIFPSSKGDFEKKAVCEGDIDGFDVSLQGSPPYHVDYEVRHKPVQGSASGARRQFDAALGKASIAMDTSKAGEYTYKFSGLADNLYNSDKTFQPLILRQRVNAKPSAAFVKAGQSFKYCREEQESEDNIPIALTGAAPFSVEIEIKHSSGSHPETYRITSITSHSYGVEIPRQYLRLGSQQIRIRKVGDAQGCEKTYDGAAPSVQIHLYDAPAIYPLETRTDYCVGERIAYTLAGTPPFSLLYEFGGQRKAKSDTTDFRRIAESPGNFTITSISDKASECRAAINLTKIIHPLPSVKISRGRNSRVDIHEGNEVEILFEFGGTPPFEFTYTRSTNERKGQKSQVLETRHDVSYEHTKVVRASQEGTYEVVAIKDKYCAYSTQQADAKERQKLLQF